MSQNFGWRENILKNFSESSSFDSQLTIVLDKDRLFTEQCLVDELARRNFTLLTIEDSISFRYIYEEKYRKQWEQGSQEHLVLISHSALQQIPFDILTKANFNSREFFYSIDELFPKLAPSVISELDRVDFDTIYEFQGNIINSLGINATQDFVLKYIFKIQSELITMPSELLNMLFKYHYRSKKIPREVAVRLLNLLNKNNIWNDWSLEDILLNRNIFIHFIQERWPVFIRKYLTEKGRIVTFNAVEDFIVKGPADLPFDDENVRIYVDIFFIEGILKPVVCLDELFSNTWMASGVVNPELENSSQRLNNLLAYLENNMPEEKSTYLTWLDFSRTWGELFVLHWSLSDRSDTADRLIQVKKNIEAKFTSWMIDNFSSLSSLSYARQPVTSNQVVHYLFNELGLNHKVALLVIDGMAISQWVLLRDSLNNNAFSLEEKCLFSWVPTLTSVSRQAIFSGKIPFLFSQSIRSSQKDETHWTQFWEDKGLQRQEISYFCQKQNEKDEELFRRISEKIEHPKTKALGMVVGTIDQSMHAIVTGSGGLMSVVSDWARGGFFSKLVASLIDNGFEVFITSDHGNVSVDGMGRPNVGSIADDRGERVYTFQDEAMRDQVNQNFPGSIAWPQLGLPSDYWCLLAPQEKAFFEKGKHAISHGGISIEEVIVPFVRIQKC